MTDTSEYRRRDGTERRTAWLGLHPNFTSDIDLGHLLQAIIVVMTVGGGILAGYLSLRDELDRQRSEFRVALAAQEARLAAAEHLLDTGRAERQQFQSEMRAALTQVAQSLATLRTELVQKQDRGTR